MSDTMVNMVGYAPSDDVKKVINTTTVDTDTSVTKFFSGTTFKVALIIVCVIVLFRIDNPVMRAILKFLAPILRAGVNRGGVVGKICNIVIKFFEKVVKKSMFETAFLEVNASSECVPDNTDSPKPKEVDPIWVGFDPEGN